MSFLNSKGMLRIGDKKYEVTGTEDLRPSGKMNLRIEGMNKPYHYDMHNRLLETADDMEYRPSGFVSDLMSLYLMTAYYLFFACFGKTAYEYVESSMGEYVRQQIRDFPSVGQRIPILSVSAPTPGSLIGQNDPHFVIVKMESIYVFLPMTSDLASFHEKMGALESAGFRLGSFRSRDVISVPVPFGESNRTLTIEPQTAITGKRTT